MNINIAKDLKKVGITVGILYAAAYALRSSTIELKNFKPEEFGIWWAFMDTSLLLNIDALRNEVDSRMIVSPAAGSTGRIYNAKSQHFPSPVVKAVDIMFPDVDLYVAYKAARRLELFTGIGVYKDWKPYKGLHLDMREGDVLAPALWAAQKKMVEGKLKQVYQVGVNAQRDF